MKLTVTTLSDRLFTLEVSEDLELENFKALCEPESGIKSSEMSVIWNGRPLQNEKTTLKAYGVNDGDMLLLQHIRGAVGVSADSDLNPPGHIAASGSGAGVGQSVMVNSVTERGRAYKCMRCTGDKYIAAKNRVVSHLYKQHLPVEAVPFHCSLCNFRCTKEKDFIKHPGFFPLHTQKAGVLRNQGCLKDVNYYKRVAEIPYNFTSSDLVCLFKDESRQEWEKRSLTPVVLNSDNYPSCPSNDIVNDNSITCLPSCAVVAEENVQSGCDSSEARSPKLFIPNLEALNDGVENILPTLLGETCSTFNTDLFPSINTPLIDEDTYITTVVPFYEPITPASPALSSSSSSCSSSSSSSCSSCDEHRTKDMSEVISLLKGLRKSVDSLVDVNRQNHHERRESNRLLHDIRDLLRHPVRPRPYSVAARPYHRLQGFEHYVLFL